MYMDLYTECKSFTYIATAASRKKYHAYQNAFSFQLYYSKTLIFKKFALSLEI